MPGQYGAVIMLNALREFTLVHVMNAALRQVAADLWTKPHPSTNWAPM